MHINNLRAFAHFNKWVFETPARRPSFRRRYLIFRRGTYSTFYRVLWTFKCANSIFFPIPYQENLQSYLNIDLVTGESWWERFSPTKRRKQEADLMQSTVTNKRSCSRVERKRPHSWSCTAVCSRINCFQRVNDVIMVYYVVMQYAVHNFVVLRDIRIGFVWLHDRADKNPFSVWIEILHIWIRNSM